MPLRPLPRLLVGALCAAPLVLSGPLGCKKGGDKPAGPGAAQAPGAGPSTGTAPGAPTSAGQPTAPAAPAIEVGMADPWARMNSPVAKSLQRGYKALNAKKWEECSAAFGEVTAALPDYLPARFYTARALLMQGKAAEARQALEELARRNPLVYASRITSTKEWQPLRDSPEWAAYQQAEARIKAAYASGLSGGLMMVARMGAAKPVKYEASAAAEPGLREAKLELGGEAVHLDPATGRYRVVTNTDGKVIAAQRSPDGKTLVFLVAERAQNKGAQLWFVEPRLGSIDLGTLEVVGPAPLKGRYSHLVLGFSKDGTPQLAAAASSGASDGEGGTWQMDSARTGLVKVPEESGISGERTEAWVDDLQHTERRVPEDIKPAADLQSFVIGEGGPPVTSAQKIDGGSFTWSPAHKLLAYAGTFEACAALDKTAGPKGDKAGDKNGLFLYDLEKKAAQRIDAGRTTYLAAWVDDGVLAFETGVGEDSRVTLYDVRTQKKTVLPTRHGAGLFGVSSHKCEEPPAAPAEAEAAPPAAPAEGAAPPQ
jgi:hypothetical protein